jgi:hypothetical protein
VAKGNSALAEIVGGKLDVHFVPNADANEILPHLARDMSQNFVLIGERHSKHCSRQHLRHGANDLNWLFLFHVKIGGILTKLPLKNQALACCLVAESRANNDRFAFGAMAIELSKS